MAPKIRIGDLAKAANCKVATIRYYEREGLLPSPARTETNYRMYGPTHVEALSFIRYCRSLDMTHDEIRALLLLRRSPEQNCTEVNTLLDAHIGHVTQRIRELRALERELKDIRGRCHAVQSTRDCGIMQSLARNVEHPPRSAGDHGKLDRTHR